MDDTAASDPACASHSHPRASLSTLPAEVKRAILAEVAAAHSWRERSGRLLGIHADMRRSRLQRTYEEERLVTDWALNPSPGLRAMSRVSRDFAVLAEEYLWNSVNLERYNLEDLNYLLTHILPPRHIRHVTSLNISPKDGGPVAITTIVERRQASNEIETAADRKVWEKYFALLAGALRDMPKLSAVYCRSSQLWGNDDPASTSAEGSEGVDTSIALVLAALGSRLVDLDIADDNIPPAWWLPDPAANEGRVATFLSHFPSLTRLSLRIRCTGPGHERLISTISSLRYLKHLDIRLTPLACEAFATATWTCPLETLFISDALSTSMLTTLLANFSTTLQTLSLQASAKPPADEPLGTPFLLPCLRTLNFCSEHVNGFLDSFVECPIENLAIDWCPGVSPNAWLAFILSHATTLKRVTIGVDGARGLYLIHRSLREIFLSNGIEFVQEIRESNGRYREDVFDEAKAREREANQVTAEAE